MLAQLERPEVVLAHRIIAVVEVLRTSPFPLWPPPLAAGTARRKNLSRRVYAEPHLTDRVVLIALILGSHR